MISTMHSGSLVSQQRTASQEVSVLGKFFAWAEAQQENRLVWLGLALMAHASVLTPFTVMAVLMLGNNFILLMAALGAMGIALVPNLAALPTRITIPAFFLSVVIDIILVMSAFLLPA